MPHRRLLTGVDTSPPPLPPTLPHSPPTPTGERARACVVSPGVGVGTRRACVETNVKAENGGGNLGTNERATASGEPKLSRSRNFLGSPYILMLKSFRPKEMRVGTCPHTSQEQGK